MRCRSLLFLLVACAVHADYVLEAPGWKAEIGPDGLLRSYVVDGESMLAPFPDSESPSLAMVAGKPEPLVVKEAGGTVVAEGPQLRLVYSVVDGQLEILAESLVMGQTVTLRWRPAAEITRAFDGEDDTMVDTVKTWYDDMVDGRWVSTSGRMLTFLGHGYWTREPYTAQGSPCFGVTIYQRQKVAYRLVAETAPSPRTALVFEILGENPDFLPPGGRPARFPCRTLNLGPKPLEVTWEAEVQDYATREPVTSAKGAIELAGHAAGTAPVAFSPPRPGVYRATLTLSDSQGVFKTKQWNFCYDFANYRPVCPRPDDFDAFWQTTLKELEAVPADLRKTEIERTASSVLYRVNYAVLWGERADGWLRVPIGREGETFPARLECPPSGVNDIPPPRESGFVEMKLAIHGFAIDKSDFPVKPPYPWPGGRYHNVGLATKDTYFYRNVYARCWRAVDLLAAMPEVNGDRIMVFGGSQGGGLAVITAAYRPRVALCAPGFPGLCRLDWTVRDEVGSWPLTRADIPEGQTLDQMLHTLSYFDVANFIGRVACPIVATIGWMDTVTAAGGQVAAFAQADKSRLTLFCAPWGRHGADSRTQQAFYRAHREFEQGIPISLPRTWEIAE